MKTFGLADKLHQIAMNRYNQKYNNNSFQVATNGKSSEYANALIDEALALCGSPFYKLSSRNWGSEAIAHLRKFVDNESGASNAACNLVMFLALVVVLLVLASVPRFNITLSLQWLTDAIARGGVL